MLTPIDPAGLCLEHFEYATGYHASARFAFHARAHVVAGNLYHHAIEMFIKGCLCKQGVSEPERKKLGHNLSKLWAKLKKRGTKSELAGFDATITDLNDFEDIRYPEADLFGSTILMGPGARGQRRHGVRRQFLLDTDDVDRLVVGLHAVGFVNPQAIAARIGAAGMKFLAAHSELIRPEKGLLLSSTRM